MEKTFGNETKYTKVSQSIGSGGFGEAYLVKRVHDDALFIAKINRDPKYN